MVQEKRILVEGFYGGDWLESFMIGTTSILPYGVKRLELSGNNLDLDVQAEDRFESPRTESEILEPEVQTSFAVRTVIVEDGRIYHRPELRDKTNRGILDGTLGFISDQNGFDNVFPQYQRK